MRASSSCQPGVASFVVLPRELQGGSCPSYGRRHTEALQAYILPGKPVAQVLSTKHGLLYGIVASFGRQQFSIGLESPEPKKRLHNLDSQTPNPRCSGCCGTLKTCCVFVLYPLAHGSYGPLLNTLAPSRLVSFNRQKRGRIIPTFVLGSFEFGPYPNLTASCSPGVPQTGCRAMCKGAI